MEFRPTFPFLVHRLPVVLTAVDYKNGVEYIQAAGYNGARTVLLDEYLLE